eukprot:scaffold644_cov126-Isochrysis_galbana.AAC.5
MHRRERRPTPDLPHRPEEAAVAVAVGRVTPCHVAGDGAGPAGPSSARCTVGWPSNASVDVFSSTVNAPRHAHSHMSRMSHGPTPSASEERRAPVARARSPPPALAATSQAAAASAVVLRRAWCADQRASNPK